MNTATTITINIEKAVIEYRRMLDGEIEYDEGYLMELIEVMDKSTGEIPIITTEFTNPDDVDTGVINE